jgi:hypothetical protein
MMRVIFYHVGKGDLALVLLPTGEVMMVDCYRAHEVADAEITDTESILDRLEAHIIEHRRLLGAHNAVLAKAAEEEDRKLKKVSVDLLALTHADRDHLMSKERLMKRFDIRFLIDSGRDYADPSETQTDYMAFRTQMRNAGRYEACPRARENIWPQSGARIDILSPNRDIAATEDNNTQGLVIRVEYAGRSFLFTGDSPLVDWTDPKTGILALHGGKVAAEVLNVSHHGSRTFFTPAGPRPEGQPEYAKQDYNPAALKAINPLLSFITCSDDVNADHPDKIALELYREHTRGGTSHVILSRDAQHVHHVVLPDGRLFMRTSRSGCNGSEDGGPYLEWHGE